MRKQETVKIDKQEFTIKELTVQEIIELTENNSFFVSKSLEGVEEQGKQGSAKAKRKKGSEQSDLGRIRKDVDAVMSKCCDFKFDNLKELAPSEIRILYDVFISVNSDFLEMLKVLGLDNILIAIKDALLSNFSKLLVTSLRMAM